MTAIAKAAPVSLAEEYGVSPRELALLAGDLSKLTDAERTNLYAALCASLGLNPLTRPFEYIVLSGRLTLYARKDCTEQLRNKHGISVEIVAREHVADCYVVTAQARTPAGRVDESIGAVPIANLKGDNLANALMKAETKAKRRVTLSMCGLGMLDETELETIPAKAKREVAPQPALPPPGKERDTLAETILRAAALGCIEDATREALTAWAAEHGLLMQGRLTPSALGKIVAALDAAETVAVPVQQDRADNPVAAAGDGDEQPQVFEPSAEAMERQAKALRQRMGILCGELKIDDARRRSMLRRRHPAIYAEVKHGEESSKALPLPHLEAFVRELEQMAEAYRKKQETEKGQP